MQCATSQLSGQITKAKIETIEQGNKLLRMAKSNADAGLRYHALEDITFLGLSDASFASRADLASQGGHLVMMINKKAMDGNTTVKPLRLEVMEATPSSTLIPEHRVRSSIRMRRCHPVHFHFLETPLATTPTSRRCDYTTAAYTTSLDH